MSSSIPSTFCVELLVCAVFVYMFASFVVSSFKVFLCVTLIAYIFAPSGLLSKLSMAFSNAKPLMTFSVGDTYIRLIISTKPLTAKEIFPNYKYPIPLEDTDSSQPKIQSNKQLQHSESTAMKRHFEKTDDLKQVNGGEDSITCKPADSSSSKPRNQSNKQQNYEKTGDQNREKIVNAIRVLKRNPVIMKPARKESFSNSRAAGKDSFTERTRGERTPVTPNTQKDAATAQKIIDDRVTNNDLFQEIDKLENAIQKLMERRLGLIPDWYRSKQIV